MKLHLYLLALISMAIALSPPGNMLFVALSAIGGVHIWTTFAMYADLRWWPLIARRWEDMILFPAALFGAVVWVLLVSKPLGYNQHITFALTALTLWHHGRQNWGVANLIDRWSALTFKSLFTWGWVCYLPAWAMLFPGMPHSFHLAFAGACFYLLWFFYCMAAALDKWDDGVGPPPAKHPYVILLALFYYSPLVLFAGKPFALGLWAWMHSTQYYYILGRSLARWCLPVIALLTYVGLQLGKGTSDVLVAIVLAANMVHFYLDAVMWKMSDPEIRKLHKGVLA